MTSNQVRTLYLDFFQKHSHALIPSAPLVPVGDPTTLFTSSGMQQLVPYFKGEAHPMGSRLVNSQPCFRAEDIDEVGDNRHTTFFEMLGNWSLGDYFKKEQLNWFFNFLTHELKLDPTRLYVSIFKGDQFAPKDTNSQNIWQEQFKKASKDFVSLGINKVTVNDNPEQGFKTSDRIFYYNAQKNWWSRSGTPSNMPQGEIGGPDSEVFFDFDPHGERQIHATSAFKHQPCHPNCDCGRFLEIGNSVFMQYVKDTDGSFRQLPKQNVDFGGGLERLVAASQDQPDVFQIDIFHPLIDLIQTQAPQKYSQNQVSYRIVADHLRASVFIAAEGVEPGSKKQDAVLKRLFRRSVWHLRQKLSAPNLDISDLITSIISSYQQPYPHLKKQQDSIIQTLKDEEVKFTKTLQKGTQQFPQLLKKVTSKSTSSKPDNKASITRTARGELAFRMYETYGFPLDLTKDQLIELGYNLSPDFEADFQKAQSQHQQQSRTASSGMFKGGLADNSETVTKLHTATHLLHAALRKVLGDHVRQEGSNITSQRLRFDFSHSQALTQSEINQIQDLVNQAIKSNLPVTKTIQDKQSALKSGALAFFKENYPEKVSVYTIGTSSNFFSKEFCGGPHVSSTGEIGAVTITKQESIGSGKRRLYAVLASA